MQYISATRAKQAFGDLLKASAKGPVAIERHGKIQAVLYAPDALALPTDASDAHQERLLARAQQKLIDKDRLIRHQRIALKLLMEPPNTGQAMIANARSVVQAWRVRRLCTMDFIERWSAMLDLPIQALALEMSSEKDPWGPALRQNSPWHDVAL